MRRRLIIFAAAVLVAFVATACGPVSWTNPFADDGYWKRALPNPSVASSDQGFASYLNRAGAGAKVVDVYEFGVPVYHATSSDRQVTVNCTMPWGACELEGRNVPYPTGAQPSTGSDAAIVVATDTEFFEFWQVQGFSGGVLQVSWGSVSAVDGSGNEAGSPTGAGVSRAAGVIRTDEVRANSIPHALVFSTNNACTTNFETPATKTDGGSTRSDCIKEGEKIRLKPDAPSSFITDPLVKAIFDALKNYGAYAIDNGGADVAFIAESPNGESDPYGGRGDYFTLPGIAWNWIEVVSRWDGG